MLFNPMDPEGMAGFWLERLLGAPRIRLADLDKTSLPAGGVPGAYLWVVSRGERVRPVYSGSGWVRDRVRREAKKLRESSLRYSGRIEVACLETPDLGLARLAEYYAITHLAPAWNGTGFGSNHPGPTRNQRPSEWSLMHQQPTPEA